MGARYNKIVNVVCERRERSPHVVFSKFARRFCGRANQINSRICVCETRVKWVRVVEVLRRRTNIAFTGLRQFAGSSRTILSPSQPVWHKNLLRARRKHIERICSYTIIIYTWAVRGIIACANLYNCFKLNLKKQINIAQFLCECLWASISKKVDHNECKKMKKINLLLHKRDNILCVCVLCLILRMHVAPNECWRAVRVCFDASTTYI